MYIKKGSLVRDWRKILVIGIGVVLVLTYCLNVHAAARGTWKQSGKLWWYQYSDKTYPKNTWEKIDGNWYYFNANGWMSTGWKKINNQWYYLGNSTSGKMHTGWLYYNGMWYYLDSSGVMQTGWEKVGAYWYFFNSSGAMLAGTVTPDGYYVNESGQWVDFQLPSGNGISYEVRDNLWIKMYYGIQTQDSYICRGAHAYEPVNNSLNVDSLEQLDIASIRKNIIILDYENMMDGYDENVLHLIKYQDGRALAIGRYSKCVDQIQDENGSYGGKVLTKIYNMETGKLLEETEEQLK